MAAYDEKLENCGGVLYTFSRNVFQEDNSLVERIKSVMLKNDSYRMLTFWLGYDAVEAPTPTKNNYYFWLGDASA